jgi:8-oxo-dGTP diphosphatase
MNPADEEQGPFPRPAVAVDLVVLTVFDADLKVLLVERDLPPFRGDWALPGGFVRVGAGGVGGESLEGAARRELQEETGLRPGWLQQLAAFGSPDRDPRSRVITVAYFALVSPDLAPRAGSDAADARWCSVASELPSLAFDHAEILAAALTRIRSELDRQPLALHLVGATFTIAELRAVYETVDGKPYDRGNFRRRFRRMLADGLVEQAPGKRVTVSKPALVYRFTSAAARSW